MAELTFAGDDGRDYRLSTQVQVVPDDIPLTDAGAKTASAQRAPGGRN